MAPLCGTRIMLSADGSGRSRLLSLEDKLKRGSKNTLDDRGDGDPVVAYRTPFY